ncbi:beta family protein [Vibrio ostreae]|uniref:Beta family protein n=1 Tax=Vibrio ostreae TaxID=2841925 RepID=A0A975U9V6_9VIBR|nr:beta family protein [Vibrio ostreae]QXO16991.1 beta family protein [Vibrio ostreae]
MSSKYYPLLKSTVSELRALKSLEERDLSNILPVFELTKSRKSKNNLGSDVYKKIDEILDIITDGEFVLDLTNEESLSNEQIESFFDDNNAFYNWTDFIRRIVEEKEANVIPMLLAYEDSSRRELKKQASRLFKFCDCISIRIPVELVSKPIVDELLCVVEEYSEIKVFIDLGYVNEANLSEKITQAEKLLNLVLHVDDGLDVVMLVSSFPSSVVALVPKDEKMSSKFPVYGQKIYNYLRKIDPELQYGDYACIHPYRGEPRPMIWIPRVDYPYDNHILFERSRREDGGYETCAAAVKNNPLYEKYYIDCWGTREIDSASKGTANGKSPSYWISVRSNIHMTRMSRK